LNVTNHWALNAIKWLCCCLLALPLRHLAVSSSFGYRLHPIYGRVIFHEGIDLRANADTVFAVFDGVVMRSGYQNGLGLSVCMAHDKWQASYGHLSQVFVVAGDSLSAGSPIGITGNTGLSTGEHLHFAISRNGIFVDPLQFLWSGLKRQTP